MDRFISDEEYSRRENLVQGCYMGMSERQTIRFMFFLVVPALRTLMRIGGQELFSSAISQAMQLSPDEPVENKRVH